ncbi:hypothetical protein ALI144C_18780 [Actinosynnema sp. ALI-1.44]|uniref:NACHT domain-containing protein n=1 Tax=Actinosynnema sp. ALI-1.44 TaxID=1933779 RepID=UPI00097BC3EC|nr:NACHT domain-containing protein [Actinosynnema sp. ALI-1.44]ONI81390.1 hypothetical protein ALI144C_18780 [Actinosynnema sp. ALI-1.44]
MEIALIRLGTAAVRAAAKLWLGDQKIAAEVSASAVDVISDRLVSHRDKRKLERLMANFADEVASRVEPILTTEFRGLPSNEQEAALDAVRAAFENSPLKGDDLFAADLDARHLARSLSGDSRHLSREGRDLYDLLLRECCGYVIEIARSLPRFSPDALTEILRREREILDGIKEVLARLPQRDRSTGFDYDYRQLVARKLDQVEMYGVTLSDASRKYPLSVAYIGLTAATEGTDSIFEEFRVEDLLAMSNRLFIRGEAGLGKTTLLHWIAVRSALCDFPERLSAWNGTVPFFLPLRRYTHGNLPAPEQFLDEIGRHIADEMPKGWVHSCLRDGTAVVLIDGVDEVYAIQRDAVRSWLRDLTGSFPRAKFVITSRPGGAPPSWLQEDAFKVMELQPMTPRDVRVFIERWHDAMRSLAADTQAKAEIDAYQEGLTDQLNTRNHLRKLAGYPLLCALLCALYKDRRSAMPSNRIELYDVALQMLLDRRDAERKVHLHDGLNRREKTLLLGDLAYWLIRNGKSDVGVTRAKDLLAKRLENMPQVQARTEVYSHLLERSGLLREPVEGRVDFIHRTFQEYLAALAAMTDADDVGTVVANAHLDQWQEVVVMSVGCASRPQRKELLSGLLARADVQPEYQSVLELLALASLETAPELDVELRADIQERARKLLPPKSLTAAKQFASAGPFVLDLLADAKPRTAKETVATLRAIAETGLPEALALLAKYRTDTRSAVRKELIRNWRGFDQEEYVVQVLNGSGLDAVSIENDQERISSLRRFDGLKSVYVNWSLESDVDLRGLPDSIRLLSVVHDYAAPPGTVDFGHIGHLANLAQLYVSVANAENLNVIDRLPNLTMLNIGRGVTAADIYSIQACASLERVVVARLDGLESLAPLAFAPSLRALHIAETTSLRNIDHIGLWARTLYDVAVVDCAVSDPAPLADLKRLVSLNLSGTTVTRVDGLASLSKLVMLNVSRTALIDISALARLANLREVDISFTQIRDLSPLWDLPRLERIIVDSSQPRRFASVLRNTAAYSLPEDTQLAWKESRSGKIVIPNPFGRR